MLPPSVLGKGLVGRTLPLPAYADNQGADVALRLGRYGDTRVESVFPTDHLQADEGSVMIATTLPGATALQLGLSASFSATAAAFVLVNSDSAGGKRIYPKFLKLAQSVAPTSGTGLRYAIVLDSANRTPTIVSNGTGGSGPGTPATATAYRSPVVCTNADVNPTIIGIPYFPISVAAGAPVTVPAAGAAARTIVGNGFIKNSIPVVLDQYVVQFGSADVGGTFQGAAALAKVVEHAPAIVIGPGQSLVIYLWSTSNVTAGSAWDDVSLCWTER